MRTILALALAFVAVTKVAADDVMCCMADQVTAKQVQTYVTYDRGNYEFGDLVTYQAYDAVNEREAYFTDRSDNLGPRQNFAYYFLYKSNVMYAYHNQSGMCVQYPIDKPFMKHCVPASAKVLEPTVKYGAGGEEDTIMASRVKFPTPRSDGTTLCQTLTLTAECVPILKTLAIYPEGGLITESIEYTNIQIGNIPEDMFNIPAACDSAPVARPMRFPNIIFDL